MSDGSSMMPDGRWALEPGAFDRLTLASSQPIAASMNGRSAMQPDAPLYTNEGGVAVIRLEGLITKRPSFWGWLFGGSASTQVAGEALAAALADQAVRSVLLVVDSPGGTVAGTEELAEAVFQARGVKPVTAYASDMCASAAYWIASQADRLFTNATSEVGSVGVYQSVTDASRMYEREGIEVNLVKSSPAKGDGARGTRWTFDKHLAAKGMVFALAAEFDAAVERGRPGAIAALDAYVAEDPEKRARGLSVPGRVAASLGLVDGITTLSALIGEMKADAMKWPAVSITVDVEYEPDQPEAAAPTSSDGIVTPGAEQKEAHMSDTTPTETALAALNETVQALAGDVKALKAEKDLDALIVQAKADRKIANAETEASVRAVGATSLDAARALVANLKVSGPEGGSVVDAAGRTSSVLAFRANDSENPETRKRLAAEAKALVASGKAESFSAALATLTGKAVA